MKEIGKLHHDNIHFNIKLISCYWNNEVSLMTLTFNKIIPIHDSNKQK